MKRQVYKKIIDTLGKNTIPILIGMRRIGKSTLLSQLAEELPNSLILRCNRYEILSMKDTEFYRHIEKQIANGYTTILLDEIQARKTFDTLLINLYDDYVVNKKIKVVATGSSTISFAKKDTGVTRTRKVVISTWTFSEYCEFHNCPRTKENFIKFLDNGGFPEFYNTNTDVIEMADSIIKPIIFDDIPTQYGVDPTNLNDVLNFLAMNTNGEFNKHACSLSTGLTFNQIEKIIDIFSKAQLIKVARRVNENGKWGKNVKKKIFINPHIHLMLLKTKFDNVESRYIGQLIESYYLFNRSSSDGYYYDYFYMKREDNKEIDFVELSLDSKYTFDKAIEFKFTDGITKNYFQTLVETHARDKIVYCLENHKDTFVEFRSILDI